MKRLAFPRGWSDKLADDMNDDVEGHISILEAESDLAAPWNGCCFLKERKTFLVEHMPKLEQ